jgi:hypothetical protein
MCIKPCEFNDQCDHQELIKDEMQVEAEKSQVNGVHLQYVESRIKDHNPPGGAG